MFPNAQPPSSTVVRNLTGFSLLLVALLWWGWWASQGWNVAGMAVHEFRQTQTALSVQAMQKTGFLLEYETPILGKPWSIPMEFPLYQYAVTSYCSVFGVDIVVGGRWVSAWCFLLGIPAFILLLREAGFSWGSSAVGVIPVIVAPVYLFYSRTVMIESMAWAASAWFLFGVFYYRRTGARFAVGLALVAGSIAVLVKGTTWAGFCLPWAFLFLYDLIAGCRSRVWNWRSLAVQAVGIGVPLLLVGFWWVAKADEIKARNPMGDFLVSNQLVEFNYGSWAARWQQANWHGILASWNQAVLPWWLIVSALVVALGLKKGRIVALLAAGGFMGVQLIFFGLYLFHDYYFYANGAMACMIVGAVLATLWDRPGNLFKSWLPAVGLAVLVGGLQFRNYRSSYFENQIAPMHGFSPVSNAIRSLLKPDEIVVVQTPDWTSKLAFQSDRRFLTIPDFRMFFHPEKVKQSVRLLADESVPLLLVLGKSQIHASWLADRIDELDLWTEPLFEADPEIRAYASNARFGEMQGMLRDLNLFGIRVVPAEPLASVDKRLAIPGTPMEEPFAAMGLYPLFFVTPIGVHFEQAEDGMRVATHSPSELYLPVPEGAQRFKFRFGINPNSLDEKDFDGFGVKVDLMQENGDYETIQTDWMSPNSPVAARNVMVELRGKTAPILIFRVTPGPRNDPAYDQVWLSDVVFE
jgi:hypothetical protein